MGDTTLVFAGQHQQECSNCSSPLLWLLCWQPSLPVSGAAQESSSWRPQVAVLPTTMARWHHSRLHCWEGCLDGMLSVWKLKQ